MLSDQTYIPYNLILNINLPPTKLNPKIYAPYNPNRKPFIPYNPHRLTLPSRSPNSEPNLNPPETPTRSGSAPADLCSWPGRVPHPQTFAHVFRRPADVEDDDNGDVPITLPSGKLFKSSETGMACLLRRIIHFDYQKYTDISKVRLNSGTLDVFLCIVISQSSSRAIESESWTVHGNCFSLSVNNVFVQCFLVRSLISNLEHILRRWR